MDYLYGGMEYLYGVLSLFPEVEHWHLQWNITLDKYLFEFTART